jgi:hypothetical protein
MCILSGCSNNNRPPAPVGPGPVDCTVIVCPPQRNFIIVYGDPGQDSHDLGRMPELAARTHEREVKANAFPGVPRFTSADRMTVAHISTVADLKAKLVGNISYLAYFGHSWNTDTGSGALFIGDASAPDTNLSNAPGANNTAASTLPANKFRSDGQVRLFGCRGGYGSNSIGEQMASQLRIPVYAYDNPGGSLFTTDSTLGHGGRSVTQADINAKIPASPANLWLVPANGTPNFRKF